MYVIDYLDLKENAWSPCKRNSWCYTLSDRFSASVINKGLERAGKWMFYPDGFHAGFVLRPKIASRLLLCSWCIDAATVGQQCHPPGVSDKCIPGCSLHNGGWCEPPGLTHGLYCPWRPTQLKEMLQTHKNNVHHGCVERRCRPYNELILNAAAWKESLPDLVEAVFSSGNEERARDVRSAFLKHFNVPPADVPLVRFDYDRIRSGDPFVLMNINTG